MLITSVFNAAFSLLCNYIFEVDSISSEKRSKLYSASSRGRLSPSISSFYKYLAPLVHGSDSSSANVESNVEILKRVNRRMLKIVGIAAELWNICRVKNKSI